MPTTPAPRTLFQRWIDDAAVFPPDRAPVPRAWSEHLEILGGPDADLLGPLLIGASQVDDLVQAVSVQPPPDHLWPVAVAVVGRAGDSVVQLVEAVRALRASTHLSVTGAEVTHGAGDWRTLVDLGLRTAVEIPTEGADLTRALDDLATGVAQEVGGEDTPAALAKLSIRSTPGTEPLSARQLGEFLTAVHERDLAFKLTGGLHRAVAPGPSADEPHGALNVLVATHHLVRGTALPELVATLETQDGSDLVALTTGLTEEDARAVRSRFVSFDCSAVIDPLEELRELGVLATPHPGPGTR